MKTFISAILGLALFASPVLAETNDTQAGAMARTPAQVKQMVTITPSGEVAFRGTLRAINASSLVVTSWGGDWTVNFSADTKYVRHFGAKSALSEFKPGDEIQAQGKMGTAAGLAFDAKMIRDESIQTRDAEFGGVISNLTANSFTLTTGKRGVLQVTADSNTKITSGKVVITMADLANGQTVSVSGVWNTKASTLAANKVMLKAEKPKNKAGGDKMSPNGDHENER